jgi:hypothetical protein
MKELKLISAGQTGVDQVALELAPPALAVRTSSRSLQMPVSALLRPTAPRLLPSCENQEGLGPNVLRPIAKAITIVPL